MGGAPKREREAETDRERERESILALWDNDLESYCLLGGTSSRLVDAAVFAFPEHRTQLVHRMDGSRAASDRSTRRFRTWQIAAGVCVCV